MIGIKRQSTLLGGFGVVVLCLAILIFLAIMRQPYSDIIDEPLECGVILKVRPTRQTVQLGEPLKFRVEIHNRSQREVLILRGWSFSNEPLQCELRALRGPDPIPMGAEYMVVPTQGAVIRLSPGTFYGEFIDLTKANGFYYKILDKGTYMATFVYANRLKTVRGLARGQSLWTGSTNQVKCKIVVK